MNYRALAASVFAVLLIVIPSSKLLASDTSNTTIVVNGIFKNKAVLLINGKRHILSIGKSGPNGVTVTAIKGETVTLSIDGESQSYKLGDSTAISTNFKQSKEQEVIVSLNARGQFLTIGSINKHPVEFLVDTGATTVAWNSVQARRIGLDYKSKGTPAMVATASGMSKAYQITLDTVSLGQIQLRNIRAMVIEGNFPVHVLLGMSFLGNLEIHRDGQLMKIKKKW